MSKIVTAVDRVATEYFNGINASNPEHERMESLGLSKEQKKAPTNEYTTLGAYVMATGALIALGAEVSEVAVRGTQEATNLGVGLGLGGLAVGATLYVIGKVTT